MGWVLCTPAGGALDGDVEDVSVLALACRHVVSFGYVRGLVFVIFTPLEGTYWLIRKRAACRRCRRFGPRVGLMSSACLHTFLSKLPQVWSRNRIAYRSS